MPERSLVKPGELISRIFVANEPNQIDRNQPAAFLIQAFYKMRVVIEG